MFLIGVLVAFIFVKWPLIARVRGISVFGVLDLASMVPQYFNVSHATHFSSVGQPLAHRYNDLRTWLEANAQQPSHVRLFGVDPMMCNYLLWKGVDCQTEVGGADGFRASTGIEVRRCPADTWIGAVALRPGRAPTTLQSCVLP
jgi:hypothetical protein